MAQSERLAPARLRFRSAILLIGLVCVSSHVVAQEDLTRDEAQKRLQETEQKLQQSRAQEQGLSDDIAVLAAERARLNSELIEAGGRVQASEAKLSGTEAKLAELTEQVDVFRRSINERKETIVRMLSAMQRMGRSPPPALVTRRDDALAVVRSAMLLADVFPELKYQADNLSKELDGLVSLETGIREQRDAQASETERLAAERASVDRLLQEKKTKLAQSEAALAQLRTDVTEQASAVTSLNDLIERLDAQIAKAEVAQYEAELAAEQALLERTQQQALATPENERVVEIKPASTKVAFASPDRMKPAIPFETAKGVLPLPAQGKKIKAFGDPDVAGGSLKGLSLQTRPEARVTAPSDGWVVYAGPFRSYGQLLIINAGGGYHVLLAGMSRIDVSPGQFVLAGEPIAEMGKPAMPDQNGDDNSRPVLYVEFRKDGKPIDSGPWWAETSEKVQG